MDNTNMLTYTDADGGLPSSPRLRFNKEGSLLPVTTSDNGIKILANADGQRMLRMLETRGFDGPRNLAESVNVKPALCPIANAAASVSPIHERTDRIQHPMSLLLVCSNSRRCMPSQADEEAHQLSYLQKHIGNILSLLADSGEAEGDESLVLSVDKFEHLGFLIFFGERGSERLPLSQNTPFFANSDPDMPAVPVLASQVLDWLIENISSTLEHISDRVSLKENGPSSSDQDATMDDISTNSNRSTSSPRGPSVIEGILGC